jgi:ankyrin repeat protein
MAAATESYTGTKKLIIAGADKDKIDNLATTLHYACVYGPTQILTLLLKQGFSLDIPDFTGDYPELWEVEKDDAEKLKIILEFKSNDRYVVDINRIQGSTNKNLLETAEHYKATKCIVYLNELIAEREEQQMSEKLANLHLDPESKIKTITTPILFSQKLQTKD